MTISLRGKTYWARIRQGSGLPRIERSLKTDDRAEAERRYRVLETMIWQEATQRALQAKDTIQAAPQVAPTSLPITSVPSVPLGVVTLQAVYERAIATHFADKKDLEGVASRWACLTRFIDPYTDVTTITRATARDITLVMKETPRQRLKDGQPTFYTVATINRCMSLLSKLLAVAHMEMDGVLSVVPKMPKSSEGNHFKRRAMTRDEYRKAVQALEAHENPRWSILADILRVLWGTGCRIGELFPKNLQWTGVDFANRAIYWDDSKGGNSVGKPMTPEVFSILKARKDSGLAAPFCDYKEWDMRKAWNWVRQDVLGIADKAEQRSLVIHSIRHAACTRILQAGHSSTKAQRLMGHKSYLTTQRYEHLDVDDLRDAAKALE